MPFARPGATGLGTGGLSRPGARKIGGFAGFNPIGGGNPSLALVDFFAADGCTWPWTNATTPAALYVASTDTTWFTWEAWDGAFRRAEVCTYNHTTGVWTDPIIAGDATMVNDDHGVPMITDDYQGYVYVFYGSHAISQQYSVTTVAGDPNNWTAKTAIAETLSYPHCYAVGSSLYLFNRYDTPNNDRPLVLHKTSALSGGVPTWGSRLHIVDLDTDSRFYQGNGIINGTDIHITGTRADSADTIRQNVYHFIYDTVTGGLRNAAGTVTVAAASLPINLATANTSFLAYNQAAALTDNGFPAICLDASNNPHIVFADGTNPPYNFLHIYHNGTSWSAPETIGQFPTGSVNHRFDGSCIVPLSGGLFDAYWISGASVGATGRGGSLYKSTRSAGGVWSAASPVLIAGSTYPLDAPITVRNGHPNAQMIVCEISGDSTLESGKLKMYAYGAGGFLRHPNRLKSWVDRITNKPGSAESAAILAYLNGLYDDEIYNRLDVLYINGCYDQAGSLLNVLRNTFPLTATAAPTFVADRGWTGNGTNQLLSNPINPSTTAGLRMELNSTAVFNYCRTLGNAVAGGAWSDSATGNQIVANQTATTLVAKINTTTSVTWNPTGTDGIGFAAASRISSANIIGQTKLQAFGPTANASSSLTNASLNILRLQAGTYSTRQVALFGGGAGLTAAQLVTLETRTNTLAAALGW